MASRKDRFLSIELTQISMKAIGFWRADNQCDQWMYHAVFIYTTAAVIFAIAVLGVDLYHIWGDFDEVTYNICITAPLVIIIIKTGLCLIHRDALHHLLSFAANNFWNQTYDEFGTKILKECNKRGMMLVCTLSCAVQSTVFVYIVKPMHENVGRNVTDRVLPFRLWVDLPTTVTPFYEITYTTQTLSAIHSGICFFCFDNLMGVLNIQVVGQFKILHQRILNLCEEYINGVNGVNGEEELTSNQIISWPNPKETLIENWLQKTDYDSVKYEQGEQLLDPVAKVYGELKKHIKQHNVLIDYVQDLDDAFNLVLLSQMGVSSIFMCAAGFKILVDKDMMYTLHLISSLIQILLFTWTGNEIRVHSLAVGDAAYCTRWYMLPYNKSGRFIREALVLVTLRAQRALFVSAGRFTPITLQAFTSIMSTTMSYLSVMRQMSETL